MDKLDETFPKNRNPIPRLPAMVGPHESPQGIGMAVRASPRFPFPDRLSSVVSVSGEKEIPSIQTGTRLLKKAVTASLLPQAKAMTMPENTILAVGRNMKAKGKPTFCRSV
jgi:hypothetical protein